MNSFVVGTQVLPIGTLRQKLLSLRSKACIEEIKLVGERQEDSPEFERARALLKQAERIAFLGFSYDKTNLERLGKNHSLGVVGAKIYGTVKDLGEAEVHVAKAILDQHRTSDRASINVELDQLDAYTLLRNKPVLHDL